MNPTLNSRDSWEDEESNPSYERVPRHIHREDNNYKSEAEKGVSDDHGRPGDGLPSHRQKHQSSTKDNPFGDEADADVKYKSMKWWKAYMIMTAETVSVGILSLPSVFATVGIVTGVILIAGLGSVALYTGYMIWQFKMVYPRLRFGYHSLAVRKEY